ncbi:AI-2E family transporter [bacterium]|nr:AI-2E family transporter [bacterium]MBT7431609.1 AI-2E family transporter [bacterium]
MTRSHFNTTFLFLLIAFSGYGAYMLFKPFLLALLIAFILSQLFKKYYLRFTKFFGKRKSLGSFATCGMILVIIIIPLIFVSSLIVSEANDLYNLIEKNHFIEKVTNGELTIPILEIKITTNNIHSIIGTDKFMDGVKDAGGFIASLVKSAYQSTSQLMFMMFVMFFALYYLFKDGDQIIKKMMQISPLKNRQEKVLINKFVEISRATLKGTLVIALLQGTLTGLLLWALGVSSAALLGVVAVFFSLIPMLGPVFVWAPAAIILLLMGQIWQGVVLIIFGTFVISLIDNILRPKLVGNDSGLHPLLIFISTFGGLALFGLIGFLIGPVIIAMFVAILHIYQTEFKEDLQEFNK